MNTDNCTYILLSYHFINTTHNSNMFQLFNGHLQAVYLIHSSNKFNKMSHQL